MQRDQDDIAVPIGVAIAPAQKPIILPSTVQYDHA
jgi:hypothetical protein